MKRTPLKTLGFIFILFWQVCEADVKNPVSELEHLFETGKYQEFFPLAEQQVEQGNVDAQFLLGKAYHLGKGVDVDLKLGRYYYELAAKQNSARAEHNLGTMYMDDSPDLAIKYFNRALELGLEMPTYFNLGIIYKKRCNTYLNNEWCKLAGDYYLQAWKLTQNTDALESVSVSYAMACMTGRHYSRLYNAGEVTAEAVAQCEQAKQWAERGAELGLAGATYKRGIIELDAERNEQALPWLRLAYERGSGQATYTLGTLQEEGKGGVKDAEKALIWFQRGAELKDENALKRMRTHWEQEISYTYDREKINAILSEWNRIEPDHEPSFRVQEHLKLIETMTENEQQFPHLDNYSLPSRLCSEYVNFYHNERWRIYAVSKPYQANTYADSLSVLTEGLVDADGCLPLTTIAREKLSDALKNGETPMLIWSGGRYLLSVDKTLQGDLKLEIGMKIVI